MYKAINVSEIHFAGRSFSVQLLASDMSAKEFKDLMSQKVDQHML